MGITERVPENHTYQDTEAGCSDSFSTSVHRGAHGKQVCVKWGYQPERNV